MRFNNYTSSLIIEDKHTILFNSLSRKYVVCKNIIVDIKKSSPSLLYSENKSLYENICNAEIIVDEAFDELGILMSKIHSALNNKTEFTLHINPTLDCNFNCWYCYENHIPNSKMDDRTLSNVLDFISFLVKKEELRILNLSFFGGEPMLHFDSVARKIINYAHRECQTNQVHLNLSFTTNGGMMNDKIMEYLSNYNCTFQITLDGSKESHNKTRFYKNGKGSYEQIVTNIHKLTALGMSVIVRINYTEDNISEVKMILNEFRNIEDYQKNNISFDFQRVWQERSNASDSTESKVQKIRSLYRRSGFVVLSNYLRHDVSEACYADKRNYVLINFNGDIFKCTARDFKTENRIGCLEEGGKICYNTEELEKRNGIKMSKEICKKCRIAPLCGGGCSQRAFETYENDSCTYNYSDEEMDGIILDIFEHSFLQDN